MRTKILAKAGDEVQTNVVLMGQGEPLLNFENVMAALRILLDEKGVGLSPKRVTLSTSGIVPGIERLGQGRQCGRSWRFRLTRRAMNNATC